MGKRWDGDGTPAVKLLGLFSLLLFNNRAYSLRELTEPENMNMSKASVSRLIKQLERSGLGCLKRERLGKEVAFRLERPERMPVSCLNAKALNELALCRSFLMNVLPFSMQRETLDCLAQMAPLACTEGGGVSSAIGAGLSKGRINYEPFQEMIDALIRAVREEKICRVRYRAAGKEKEYGFAPGRLLLYHESLYAEGWVAREDASGPLHEKPSKLAVHRLVSCELTGQSSGGFPELPAHKGEALGVMQGEPFTVVVRFSGSAAAYAAERQWSAGQRIERHEDGSITLEARMFNIPECVSWVLGFRTEAEVLEPEWLREKIKGTLLKMRRLYLHGRGQHHK
ncbi:MAG: WYL domain-containing protein [Desulfovibrionaceae bacterium]|nr:WYL domain-containing protein [Desulfovibrionaceae bacterium]